VGRYPLRRNTLTEQEACNSFILKADLQLSYQTILSSCWREACAYQREKDAVWLDSYDGVGKRRAEAVRDGVPPK